VEWTPELDTLLIDLYKKRLGNAFIASWMRIQPGLVRDRLVALGLVKPSPTKVAAAPTRKELRAAAMGHGGDADDAAEDEDLSDDEDDADQHANSKYRRRPRGYLMSLGEIEALYRSVGRSYR
jgi:hypothetical protein